MNVIECDGLSVSYGDTDVLSDVSFIINEGDFISLVGPNGVGKTTLIQVLTGQLHDYTGNVSVFGMEPRLQPIKVNEEIGILPEKQSPALTLTPREFLKFVGLMNNLEEETIEHRIEEWANRLSLREELDVKCEDLSRGQQQKVMFAQAFITEPELVFVDEPVANLDPMVQEVVKNFLIEYNNAGNTIILSTHHVDLARELSDELLLLSSKGVKNIKPSNLTNITEHYS